MPWRAFDIRNLEAESARIEAETQAPDFWSDNVAAQAAMRRLTQVNDTVTTWRGLEKRIADTVELAELADAEPDEEISAHVVEEIEGITAEFDRLELQLAFMGEYDGRNAIFAIHAGAGGTESQDWAEMLLRMYLRWAEGRGFKTELLEASPGEEAGLKSATFTVSGENAYGVLKAERGVHRLVRLSPFDQAHRRHTSFAQVIVSPLLADDAAIEIDESELRIDTYRASGAGGQHVNKTDSAVRITHIPTNIVVSVQNERSQLSNKNTALKILRSRLAELEQEQREEEVARERGEVMTTGFGSQIRSYVLHPYQLVKDHRTDVEEGNTQGVLDGNVDPFIQAYLLQTAAQSGG
jgi:peptide chain release factor 2